MEQKDNIAHRFFLNESQEAIQKKGWDHFKNTGKLTRAEKYKDLHETSDDILPLSPFGLARWKHDIKRYDLVNVDVTNLSRAMKYQKKN